MLGRVVRFVLPLLVVAAVLPASPASAYTSSRTHPVILVHGYDAYFGAGYDGPTYWGSTKTTLQNLGWTRVITLKYYQFDTNFDASLDGHGSHSVHFPSGHADGSHTQDTDLRHLAYHFAWFINNTYGSNVQVIGHSMGGTITRTMVHEFQAGDPDYPATLNVQDVVTWGTPHNGSGKCFTNDDLQAQQMCEGGSFVQWLNTNNNPQASGGTDWTVVGSSGDTVTSASSATHMGPVHKVIYIRPRVTHSGFLEDTSLVDDASVDRSDNGSAFTRVNNTHHTIKWADKALFLPDW